MVSKKNLNFFILKYKGKNLKLYKYLVLHIDSFYIEKTFSKQKHPHVRKIIISCIFRYFNSSKISLFKKLEFFFLKKKRKIRTVNKYLSLLLFYKYLLLKTLGGNSLLNGEFFFMGGLQANNLNLFKYKNGKYRKIFYNYYKALIKKKKMRLHYKSIFFTNSKVTYTGCKKLKKNYNYKFKTRGICRYFIVFSPQTYFLSQRFNSFYTNTQKVMCKKMKLKRVSKFSFLLSVKKIKISRVFLFKENNSHYLNPFLKKNVIKLEKIKAMSFIKLKKKSTSVKKRRFIPLLKKQKNKNALYTQSYIKKKKHAYIKKFVFFYRYSYLKKHFLNNLLQTIPHKYCLITKYGSHYKKAADRLKKILLLKYIKNKKKKIYKTGLFFFLKRTSKRKYSKIKGLKLLYTKKKSIYVNYLNIIQKKEKREKIIYNNLFLNKFSVKSFFIDFYLNSKQTKNILKNKKKQKKTFFFNFWKKKLTTFKCARAIHWGYYTKKTIKKRRYKNFLSFFLKKLGKSEDYIINCFVLKFNLSYIFWKNFTTLYLEFFEKKIKEKIIYQIPVSLLFWTFLKKNQSIKKKIQKKIQKWIKNKKKIQKKFWMKSKQNIPPFFSKQTYHNKHASNGIQYDFLTNYFCILKKKKVFTSLNGPIGSNKLLKLHDFRYKA